MPTLPKITIETLSIFPEAFASVTGSSIIKRAQSDCLVKIKHHDLRNWTHDRHRSTDDEPYGGGPGQLMCAPPFFEAIDDICSASPDMTSKPYIIAMTPAGEPYTQEIARELAAKPRVLLLCGHYEGIDERVYSLCDRQISIGDYVLTGGELPAMVLIDSIVRLVPGVLGNSASVVDETFTDNLLEYPQYTRPAQYRNQAVPEVLLSGNHAEIAKWRNEQRVSRTKQLRPDL